MFLPEGLLAKRLPTEVVVATEAGGVAVGVVGEAGGRSHHMWLFDGSILSALTMPIVGEGFWGLRFRSALLVGNFKRPTGIKTGLDGLHCPHQRSGWVGKGGSLSSMAPPCVSAMVWRHS